MRRVVLCIIMLCAASAHADNHGAASDLHWSVLMEHTYRVEPDITYLIADGYESKLDVIAPRDTTQKLPTLIYIHGGGWVGGTKERSALHYLRYLQMGFAVVNVEYRMARDALAPAAVEDTRCALRWVINNADQYGFDANRIVVSGHSAGGHLSLTTGMLPASARFDRRCPRRNPLGAVADADFPEMKVAAIVNWFGITDVADLVEGDNAKTYAVAWLGGMRDWKLVAKEVSPLTYVRRGLPPIITIHGNADTIVPYDHAVRLHKQLNRRKVANQLITIEGGGHGGFPLDEHVAAMEQVRSFLQANGVLK